LIGSNQPNRQGLGNWVNLTMVLCVVRSW